MRKRALLIVSMLCLCAFGVAKYVASPVAAEDETGESPTITAEFQTGRYLLQHVATGKYLGAANDWGTQASLIDNPEFQTLIPLEDGKYHLESQVDNGNSNYYFNGSYLDASTPVELEIQKRQNGYYTISDGNIFYGYDGSSSVLGKTSTDPTDTNVQWRIVSQETAVANLSLATESQPRNATFLLSDPNFGRNNRYYEEWTFEASNKNISGDVRNFCVESWRATFLMSQTISVPNGVYGLTAQGFYRQEGSDAEHLPEFFANNETCVFPQIAGSENSMSDASISFMQGMYFIEPIYVVVTDGTLQVGARLEGNTMLWSIWDNFTLMYYGTDTSAANRLRFNSRFNKVYAQVQAMQQTTGITTEASTALAVALTAYEGINPNTSVERQQEVKAQLEEAIAIAEEGLQFARQLRNAYEGYGEKLAATGLADNSLITVLAAVQSALNAQQYESRNQIAGWIEQLTTARKEILPYEYRYWFDTDADAAVTDYSTTPSWHVDLATDDLSESFHLLHIQVKDDTENWSTPITRPFVKMLAVQEAQGCYWFDGNYDSRRTADLTNAIMDIDVASLADGFHSLHYMAQTTTGASTVHTAYFQKISGTAAFSYQIWDSETPEEMITGKLTGSTLQVNVDKFSDGFHTLYVQVAGATSASIPQSAMFIKVPQTIGVDYLNCLLMVDGKLFCNEQVSNEGGVLTWKVPVDTLSQGLHRYMVQVVTPSGAGSSMKEGFFFRVPTQAELASLRCCYMVDGDSAVIQAGTVANGLYHFDLDVSKLTDGIHKIAYWLVAENGVNTTVNAAFFWKIPVGGSGVTQYEYWLNDLDDDKHVTRLSKRQDPFSLLTLLPIESQPIRSSNFQFAVKNGKPLIYARNEIHMRFYDAAGRFTETVKEYNDEQVSRSVEPVGELQATQTFPKVGENDIRWYTLQAEQGDSLQFKLDRAATIQLFSPSGKEVYSASGSTSVSWGGSHVGETGTYYLALHDVTAQQGNTVSIDYNRIGKYAIMAYTPNSLSTDGTTIMYLKGNGLQYVQSVELVGDDIILDADTIVSNVTDLLARFTLNEGNDAAGNYYLRVRFHNEDEDDSRIITQHQPITLRQADKGDITVKVVTERRVSDPYPIKVYLKNNGNVGLYGIPVNIAYDHPEMIDEFQFVNFDMLLSEDLYENRLFFAYTDDLVGTGKKGFFLPLLIPYLGPNEEKTFIFGVRTKNAHAKFNFYAWAGDPMYDGLNHDGENSGNMVRRKAPACTPSNIPDVYDALGDADNLTNMPISPSRVLRPFIGAAEAISGIIQGSTRAREDAVFDAAGIPQSKGDDYRFQYRHCVRSPYDIARDAHPLQAPRRAGGAGGGAAVDGHANGDCPHPDPHPTDVYIPGDPNEITGYLAESGSHYITDSIKTVGYDIEFENDPELANSSAHRIVIENQLDPEVFDLSSFVPNEIKLSNRTLELTGETPFIQTIDLRPNINAIAQVEGNYDAKNGKIKWTLQSLDPMTMEPTDDIMQGVLPINNSNGDGIGHVTYSVDLRTKLEDGTGIPNKATIVFDYNEAIETPTWTNIVDAVAPTSTILGAIQSKTDTLTLRIAGEDARSGVWRYDVYAQMGDGTSWELVAENVPATVAAGDDAEEGETETLVDVRIYDGIEYGFLVLATDSAGNVERKSFEEADFRFTTVMPGDANGDGVVDALDVVLAISYYLGEDVYLNFAAADVVADGEINALDVVAMQDIYLNTSHQALAPRKRKVKSQQLEQRLQ